MGQHIRVCAKIPTPCIPLQKKHKTNKQTKTFSVAETTKTQNNDPSYLRCSFSGLLLPIHHLISQSFKFWPMCFFLPGYISKCLVTNALNNKST